MGRARRDVEHVARFCLETVPLLKVGEQFEAVVIPKRGGRVARLAGTPQPLALDLYEEHIVIIEVRADTAASGSSGDRRIIVWRARPNAVGGCD